MTFVGLGSALTSFWPQGQSQR